MFGTMRFLFIIVFCLVGSYQKSAPDSTFYTAAVVEYSPVSEVGDDGMHGLVSRNVRNYIQFIEDAAQNDADIIVFPEVGLVSYHKEMYASVIPDPRNRVNPCTNNSVGMLEEMVQLSCAARNNSIYVVINFPEVKVCEEVVPGSDCTHVGTSYYNTDVVFDSSGSVVLRYRKYHLFIEPEFNRTATPELSTFETDFGVVFGVFTCFDILFKTPPLTLVEQFNVTDVAVPQAWFSELPFLTAVQSQSQWSYATDVNLLAAGYSKPSVGSTGSGIYNGRNGALVTIFSNVNTSKLLLATVPKKVASKNNLHLGRNHLDEFLNNDDAGTVQPVCQANDVASQCEHAVTGALSETSEGIYLMKQDLSAFTTLPLDVAGPREGRNVSEQLCSDDLCCDFTVHTTSQSHGSESPGGSHYRIVAYSGMRSFVGAADGGIQVCGIVSCANESLGSCGLPPGRVIARPTFSHISIIGSFNASNALQMPNAITTNFKIINPRSYSYTSRLVQGGKVSVTFQSKESIDNLLTFAIFGRYFDNDVLH